jgi:hypothetical protein
LCSGFFEDVSFPRQKHSRDVEGSLVFTKDSIAICSCSIGRLSPGRFNDEEFQQMKQHALLGYQFLQKEFYKKEIGTHHKSPQQSLSIS